MGTIHLRFGSEVDFSSPCLEPAGRWVLPDPKHATQQEASGASAYAESQPDIVNSWVTHFDPANPGDTEFDEFDPVIFNAVFAGDVERHEAEIRKRWPGPLCVVEGEGPTKRELSRIRAEAEAYVTGELGLQMLGSSTGGVEPIIEIGVVADPGGAGQAALDARWPGIVRLFPALSPGWVSYMPCSRRAASASGRPRSRISSCVRSTGYVTRLKVARPASRSSASQAARGSPSLGWPTDPGFRSQRRSTRSISVPAGAWSPSARSPSRLSASGTWLCPTRTIGASVASSAASATAGESTYSHTGSRGLAW